MQSAEKDAGDVLNFDLAFKGNHDIPHMHSKFDLTPKYVPTIMIV